MLWWKFKHNLRLDKAGQELFGSLDVWETCWTFLLWKWNPINNSSIERSCHLWDINPKTLLLFSGWTICL